MVLHQTPLFVWASDLPRPEECCIRLCLRPHVMVGGRSRAGRGPRRRPFDCGGCGHSGRRAFDLRSGRVNRASRAWRPRCKCAAAILLRPQRRNRGRIWFGLDCLRAGEVGRPERSRHRGMSTLFHAQSPASIRTSHEPCVDSRCQCVCGAEPHRGSVRPERALHRQQLHVRRRLAGAVLSAPTPSPI